MFFKLFKKIIGNYTITYFISEMERTQRRGQGSVSFVGVSFLSSNSTTRRFPTILRARL